MSKIPILQPDQSYTFRYYFEMSYGADEILAEFGYTFASDRIPLPKTEETLNFPNYAIVSNLSYPIFDLLAKLLGVKPSSLLYYLLLQSIAIVN